MSSADLKIGACIMIHNMAPFIRACIHSLQWVDAIYLYDDHSTDRGVDIAHKESRVPLTCEHSRDEELAFQKGELEVRNRVIDRAFDVLKVDVLVIADADELFSSLLKEKIVKLFSNSEIDSMAFSIWHLYDEKRYIHLWELTINGVSMIDPHTRVIRKTRRFVSLFEDGGHPILRATEHTACIHEPCHFHLKYFYKSTFPNYSIYFLPERIGESDVAPYLRKLPFDMPTDISHALKLVDWDALPYYAETPHHGSERVVFTNPDQALIHPSKYMEKRHD
jgi:glycosyltransferase involved in cell wall biosynthesis